MQMLDSIRKTMLVFPKSYINYNNELILIPKFNVYICLDNIISDEDFYVELCEYFSRECSSALRSSSKPIKKIWQNYVRTILALMMEIVIASTIRFTYKLVLKLIKKLHSLIVAVVNVVIFTDN